MARVISRRHFTMKKRVIPSKSIYNLWWTKSYWDKFRSKELGCALSVPLQECSTPIYTYEYMLLLPEGQMGKVPGTFQKVMFLRKSETIA